MEAINPGSIIPDLVQIGNHGQAILLTGLILSPSVKYVLAKVMLQLLVFIEMMVDSLYKSVKFMANVVILH